MNDVAEYLEHERRAHGDLIDRQRGWHYSCPADLVLREGVEMEPTVYDPETWGRRGLDRQCYFNAQMLALRHLDRLRYVEGYACGVIPCSHGWCVDVETGAVVDPTWTGEIDRPTPRAYMGVVFPHQFLTGYVKDGQVCLIDDWRHDWPLLHQPLAALLAA